jgi:hypothetical protein
VDPLSPDLGKTIDFLISLSDKGLEYSAVNTAQCALSAVLCLYDNQVFGKHELVIRFMKGVFNEHPPRARYSTTWDVQEVLVWLRKLSPVKLLSLKDLSLKLVVLMALVSAQRCQTLHLLDLRCLTKGAEYKFNFASTLKHSRPGKAAPQVVFSPYPPDRRLCVITVLKEYLRRTAPLRKSQTKLLISYVKPHRGVTGATVSRWIKCGLTRAGIDVLKYKSHSTRMAGTSKAKAACVPLDMIMSAAGWSSAGTYAKFYHKPVAGFQDGVLS